MAQTKHAPGCRLITDYSFCTCGKKELDSLSKQSFRHKPGYRSKGDLLAINRRLTDAIEEAMEFMDEEPAKKILEDALKGID